MPGRRRALLNQLSAALRRLSNPLQIAEEGLPEKREAAKGPDEKDGEGVALESFSAEFEELVSNLEPRFLPLGQHLGDVVEHLQHLGRVAEEGFITLREAITGGALGDLDGLGLRCIESVQTRLSELSQRIQPLEEVAADLAVLRSLGKELKRVGGFLRACGTNFVVESARREETRQAFSAFVVDLRELASQISMLAERIDEASQTTLRHLNVAHKRIQEDLKKVHGLAGSMHGALSGASGEISRLITETRAAVDRVERQRQAITQKAGSIIYYLQFGDLVRQQCEHVVAGGRDAAAAAAASDDMQRLSLPLIVRTAAAQMELIQGEVNEARQRLTDSYHALGRELEELADCGSSLGCGNAAARSETSGWTRLKTQLLDLDSIQQQEQKLSEAAGNTARDAGAACASLHAGLTGVRQVSGKLHFLALNAIVQTAHLGDRGRTLEELAKHVNALHRECEVIVPKLLQVLDSIGDRVTKLSEGGHAPERLDLGGLQQMEEAQNRGRDAMRELLTLSATGGEKLTRALSGLEILTELAAKIAEHREALETIRDRLPEPPANTLPAEIEARIVGRYTMQSERDAHERARTGQAAPANSAATAYPANDSGLGEPAMAAADADAFGDNIELF